MKKPFSRTSKYALSLFVFVLALSLTLGMAYGQADHSQNGLTRAIEAQDMHTERLMAISGVVGTGTGIGADGEPVIRIYTTRAGIPGIPRILEGFPVEVKVTGMIVALVDPKAWFPRPVPIGVSTGHPEITAGTIGCRVKDNSGNFYALSNNHVYANSNDAAVYDSELQPGALDGGTDTADKIGELWDFEPIYFDGRDNIIDAAIASTTTSLVDCKTPSDGYGTPSSEDPDDAYIGQEVKKYGRTTGLQSGSVSGINVTVDVCYKTRGPLRCNTNYLARFKHQIEIGPAAFSDGGDSGSLIVTGDSNKPVGLLFAGSITSTFANPIGPVLSRFGVTVDDCSGSEPCTDGDGDGYCVEVDCDDSNSDIYPGATEICDGQDNQCPDDPGYGVIDEGLTQATSCGVGECASTGFETCTNGVWGNNTCAPEAGSDEVCDDGLDNDCDGSADCADAADCESLSACICLPPGATCSSDSDCCSSKCKGRPGGKTCK